MATSKPKIFDEIEATAKNYGPSIYAGLLGDNIRGLLSFYHDVQFSIDGLSDDFVPVTQTRTQDARVYKLFAVGVLPPTARVTGRILDRSHSIAGDERTVGGAASGGVIIESLKMASAGLVAIAKSFSDISASKNQKKWVDLLAGPNEKDNAAYFASSSISSCALVVRGLLRKAGLRHPRLAENYKIGKAMEDIAVIAREYDAYHPGNTGVRPKPGWVAQVGPVGGSGHVFTIISVKAVGGKIHITSVDGGQKDGTGAQATRTVPRVWKKGGLGHAKGAKGKEVLELDKESRDKPGKWWWDNNGSKTRRVQFMMDTSKLPFEDTTLDDDATDDWKDGGNAAAKKAKKEQQKTGGTSLNQQKLGKILQAAQRLQIAETQAAIEAMKRAPPLRLVVNPKEFSVKGAKIVQDGAWGRSGPIVEHWGEEQDSISASGRVAGFFAIDATGAQGPGLTRHARHFSEGWRNLMALYLFYKNNGGVYLQDHITFGGTKRNLSLVGSVYIYYDNILYIGSFNSFNISEANESPFTAEYNFEFVVRAAFLLDRPDAQYDVSNSYSQGPPQPTVPVTGDEDAGGVEQPPSVPQPPPGWTEEHQKALDEAEAEALAAGVEDRPAPPPPRSPGLVPLA